MASDLSVEQQAPFGALTRQRGHILEAFAALTRTVFDNGFFLRAGAVSAW